MLPLAQYKLHRLNVSIASTNNTNFNIITYCEHFVDHDLSEYKS
jgi:hypothetical protein